MSVPVGCAGSLLGKAPTPDRGEIVMKFRVALYQLKEGIAVSVLALPGCWSSGDTVEEALANIRDAVREYLEAEVPPEEGAEIREVEVTL
jgi:predicted RNase H-like HicB family nuclease